MHERAEIEAVVDALARLIGLVEGFAKGIEMRGWALPEVTTQMYAETAKAREALDRVRDARGDNEKQWTCDACEDTGIDRREGIPCGCGARPPQGEDHENCPDCWEGRPKWAGTMPAPPCPTCEGTGKIPWSPQPERR
jgi:hypothetical protein